MVVVGLPGLFYLNLFCLKTFLVPFSKGYQQFSGTDWKILDGRLDFLGEYKISIP